MTVPARITLVALGVADVDRSSAFFEALGWRRSAASQPGDIVFIHTSGAVLTLFGFEDLAADAQLPAEPLPAFRGVTLAINVEDEKTVDAALAEAAAAGGTVIKPAVKAEWGGYSGYFTDLDGYAWEVAYNPSFPIAADGTIELPA